MQNGQKQIFNLTPNVASFNIVPPQPVQNSVGGVGGGLPPPHPGGGAPPTPGAWDGKVCFFSLLKDRPPSGRKARAGPGLNGVENQRVSNCIF